MRIWSIHPKYLDAKGLVALWRETLLAKHVLEGKTKGYRNHPQLNRFKELKSPLSAINDYLSVIYDEALTRAYNFDNEKFKKPRRRTTVEVTQGQMDYELKHLLKKLKHRDKAMYKKVRMEILIQPHPLFKIVSGPVEDWEIV